MAIIPPSTDSDARSYQRATLRVLDNLLSTALPSIRWDIDLPDRYGTDGAALCGWVGYAGGRGSSGESDDEKVSCLTTWARFLQAEKIEAHPGYWIVKAKRDDVVIHVYCNQLSKEYLATHTPPPLIPDDMAGQFVRRSEHAEAVAS